MTQTQKFPKTQKFLESFLGVALKDILTTYALMNITQSINETLLLFGQYLDPFIILDVSKDILSQIA